MAKEQQDAYRICLAIPSLQAGGMERVMTELANYFSSLPGNEVTLVLYGIRPVIDYQLSERVGVVKPSFTFNNRLRLFYTVRTLLFLRQAIVSARPSVVLSFGEYWNSFVLLSVWGISVPVFVSDRNQPGKSLGLIHDRLRRWLYPGAAGIIAQTVAARMIYEKQRLNQNIQVIGNPIRSIAIVERPRESIVLSVGRLIRTKHHDRLIQLFARINLPGWKLVIVGYDHLKQENRAKLEALVSSLGMTDKVILAGKQANVDEYYRSSAIFAFTSTSEGFPNVIGEAMSAGLAVVSFDCLAGPADMIENGVSGLLVPNGDFEAFQERLGSLMRDVDRQRQLGSTARSRISRFSVEEIGSRYLNFLKSR